MLWEPTQRTAKRPMRVCPLLSILLTYAGKVLVEKILELMQALNIPDGLSAIGYTEDDIPKLVEGTLPQHRVTKLSPRPVDEEALTHLFKRTMKIY